MRLVTVWIPATKLLNPTKDLQKVLKTFYITAPLNAGAERAMTVDSSLLSLVWVLIPLAQARRSVLLTQLPITVR